MLGYIILKLPDRDKLYFLHNEKVSGLQNRVFDKLTYAGNIHTLPPVMEKESFYFVKLDICDCKGVYRLFRRSIRTLL